MPKFLVNKWLNIKQDKSKFTQLRCQVDNKDDVSVYSETTMSIVSSPKLRQISLKKQTSKFSSSNNVRQSKKTRNNWKPKNGAKRKEESGSISMTDKSYTEEGEFERYPSLLKVKATDSVCSRTISPCKDITKNRVSERSIGLGGVMTVRDRTHSDVNCERHHGFKDLDSELLPFTEDLIIETDESSTVSEGD